VANGEPMHYDITTLTVRPGATPRALPLLDQWLGKARLRGKLLACWFTEWVRSTRSC
jgi:hypothetical protein